MLYRLFLIATLFLFCNVDAQIPPCNYTSNTQQLKEIKPSKEYDNILNMPLCSDSLSSSFIIWIKKEVKAHKHLKHSENIYVIEGAGRMKLGKDTFDIAAGDYIFIPQNTIHEVVVKSNIPLKVLSVQSPYFDGKDRVSEY